MLMSPKSNLRKMKARLLPSILACLSLPSSTLFSPVSSAIIQTWGPVLPLLGSGGLGGDHAVECTNSTAWMDHQIPNKQDCVAAVAKVKSEYDTFGDGEFEFLAPDITPRSGRPLQKTPRRFQAGKCEVTIAMTRMFKPGMLPGKAPGRLPSDIATWKRIFNGYVLSDLSYFFAYIICDYRKAGDRDLPLLLWCNPFIVGVPCPPGEVGY